MTKFDIRVLTMAYLEIESGVQFIDIGSGTGSIAIQGAKLGAETTAIESKREAIELIEKNIKQFDVSIDLIHGMAPEDCPNKMFERVFLGGNRGKMDEIFLYLEDHLLPGGIIVANFVTLKSAGKCRKLLDQYGYKKEIKLIHVAQEDSIGILRGQNPIYIMKGVKE